MKITDYTIVSEGETELGRRSPIGFEVHNKIKYGWQPYGSPVMTPRGIQQAMVKYEDPPPSAVPETFSHEIFQMAHVAHDLGHFMKKHGLKELGGLRSI